MKTSYENLLNDLMTVIDSEGFNYADFTKKLESDILERLMDKYNNKLKVAALIGMSRQSLQYKLQSRSIKKDKFGYIYIMESSGKYKIGISKSVKRRFSNMKTSNPDIKLETFYHVNGYKDVEKQLHKQFEGKHVSGEWFDLDKCDLNFIKNYIMLKS